MSYLGIERCGPILTPEEIEARNNISTGYGIAGNVHSFMCRECLRTCIMPDINHREACKTGKIIKELARRS